LGGKRDLIMAVTIIQPDASPRGAASPAPRRFDFARDTFAFANELIWEYRFDPATGRTVFRRREPKPAYAHRCFVLTRAARQFLYHARFDPEQPVVDDETYRHRIRAVLSRNPRAPGPLGQEVVLPGYAGLRDFSAARPELVKSTCGGAWRSYALRSHWRMVFPISRAHQARTATRLVDAVRRSESPIVHLVRFPQLSINHGMVLLDADPTPDRVCFRAYDPNDPARPAQLGFDRAARAFSLPANSYWAGGRLEVIEIYRTWFL
jgi:hypothetical protein